MTIKDAMQFAIGLAALGVTVYVIAWAWNKGKATA